MTVNLPMRRAGFFVSAAEIAALANSTERPWESSATRYLDQGAVVVVSLQWVDDLVDQSVGKICQYSVLTDGTWIWPGELAYYLTTYHVALPEEFLSHMVSNGWAVPKLDAAEMEAICDDLISQSDAF